MKKIIALLLISFGLQSQTLLKFKQIEQSGATGSLVITTGTNGVLTYTPQIPYSKITGTPSLSGYVPYTGANSFTTTNNITANVFIPTSSIVIGSPSYTDNNIWSFYQGSANNYYQSILQNSSNGSAASVDFVVSNDLGTKTNYYGNFGMNSSGYTGSPIFSKPNAVYLTAQDGDLCIGTTSNNAIHIAANNASSDAITVNSSNNTTVSGTFYAGSTATVNGNSQLTGSVNVGAAATQSALLQVNTSAVGTGALIGNARIGVWGGSASYAVFRHQSETDATGYALIQDNSGFTYLNASTQVQCLVGANAIATFTDRKVNFNPVASSSGANINFNFTCPNSTGQTASTNAPYFKVIGGTKQFATGAHTTLYFNHLSANTLAYVGASTATDVYGLFVEKSVAGTNATITRNWGIGTNGAISCVDNLKITSANNPSISIGATGSFIRDISGLIRVASANSANVELAYNATSVRLVAGANGVSITKGSDAVASAALEVSSTTQGFLPPRMTTTQKNAISSPSEGLVVYDTTLHKLCIFTGTVWETVTSL